MPSVVQVHRSYWNTEIESRLNTPGMKDIQWAELKKRLEYFYEATPFWRSRMERAGNEPGDVRTWDDFHKRIPVLTKDQ
ncbi:MAG: hypothetical protein HZA60_06095 [Deltaproteobacteria bacterium]|nr:hypothetical protein [Deltaproteobacteria bacterium]